MRRAETGSFPLEIDRLVNLALQSAAAPPPSAAPPLPPVVVPHRRYRISVAGESLDGEHVDARPEQLGPYGAFRVGTHDDLVTTLGLAVQAIRFGPPSTDPATLCRMVRSPSLFLRENGVPFCIIGGQAVNAYDPVVSLDVALATGEPERVTALLPPPIEVGRFPDSIRLEDVLQGKIWAASDEIRRPSKRQNDLVDIARLLETFPELRSSVPAAILDRVTRRRGRPAGGHPGSAAKAPTPAPAQRAATISRARASSGRSLGAPPHCSRSCP